MIFNAQRPFRPRVKFYPAGPLQELDHGCGWRIFQGYAPCTGFLTPLIYRDPEDIEFM
jgi:hypothetical protein